MPPTPTPAMFSFSLGGGVSLPAKTCRGSMVTVAAAKAVLPKKARREVRDGSFRDGGRGSSYRVLDLQRGKRGSAIFLIIT